MRALCVIILNYATPDLAIACADAALADLADIDGQIIVVDNASPDDSRARLAAWRAARPADAPVALLHAPSNGGFASGNNLGLGACDAEFYMLLNSDALVRPGAFAALLRAMRADERLGIVGPAILDGDGAPAVSAFRDPSPLGEFVEATGLGLVYRLLRRHVVPIAENEACDPQWIGFPAVMLRKRMIDEIGLLDEGYFMYFEDADYCRRARRAGWRIARCARAKAQHLHGRSSGIEAKREAGARLPQYYYASRARYFQSWYGRFGLLRANILWCAGRSVNALRVLALKAPKPTNRKRARDIWTRASGSAVPRRGGRR